MFTAIETLEREAVFLDRDGVIIENCDNYVRSWDDVDILPGALDALVRLAESHYKVFIVTNQAGVGKGLIPVDVAHGINTRLIDIIHNHGGRVDAATICPHRNEDACGCRKPEPGMLLNFADRFDINLNNSWMIGDAVTDIQAGLAAGTKPLLVQTGRGTTQEAMLSDHQLDETPVFADLEDAVSFLLSQNA